ncbi:MAG TPA: glycoside hydrolase family 88 protein [Candidatus Dormibacteraeota bacterium]|nr:glycoside hydrolase family 88 protein [Candidatus Dormibacteraeota bacterium]
MNTGNRFESGVQEQSEQSSQPYSPEIPGRNRLQKGLGLVMAIAVLGAGGYFAEEKLSHGPTSPGQSILENLHETIPLGDIQTAFNIAGQRLLQTAKTLPTGIFPYSTDNKGNWKLREGPKGWIAGFFPGSLWLMYEQTGKEMWKQEAETWTYPIKSKTAGERDHEIGLVFIPSYGNGYELTKSEAYKKALLDTAATQASKYNSQVGAIGSVIEGSNNSSFRVVLDNIMSLELLFWAAKNGGDRTDYNIATQHALTVMNNFVRPNGSVYHDANFDPITGKLERRYNDQGYSDTSTWSRGQAWALAGFTMAYQATGNPQFLDTAQKTADYFINNLPSDYVPYWDYQAPNIPEAPRDSSAAAIAASYLLELSTLDPKPSQQEKYFVAGQNILASLISPRYLAKKGDAILAHATQNMGAQSYDTGLVYGDYYLLQALERYEKITARPSARQSSLQIGLSR